ncbi:MAG: hypothetical protein IBX69_03630 [Anaerolineales bacterium]|nr:hypothetical protein [Anaerolineales bacterium]
MAVHIDEISVQHLGPLPDFYMKLGRINLIYGHNESGKTYLVEFIIRSLFKSQSAWRLRPAYASGRVVVSGLDGQMETFSPSGRRKLDDYWQNEKLKLPSSLSRLLVIKAGEVWLAKDDPGGVDYKVLKEYLSNSWIIDEVREGILVTTRDAEIINKAIEGTNKGDLKRRKDFQNDLAEIDRRIEQFNESFSSGELAEIDRRLQQKQTELEAERRARRGAAYRLDREIRQLEDAINDLPEADIQGINQQILQFEFKEDQVHKIQRDYQEKRDQSSQFEWLQKAVAEYESKSAAAEVKTNWLIPAAFGLVLLAALLFTFFGEMILAGLALLGLLLLGWLYLRRIRLLFRLAVDIKHLDDVAAEYERRMGEKMRDIATLKAKRDEQAVKAEFASEKQKDLLAVQQELHQIEFDIARRFYMLTGKNVAKEDWRQAVDDLQMKLRDLHSNKTAKQHTLDRWGVAPQEYLEEAADLEHDDERYNQLERECGQLEAQKAHLEENLSNLKYSLAGFLKLDSPPDWETLIEKLQEKRRETADQYRACTAKILAGILVNQELEQMAQAEDERIRAGLSSPQVLRPLKQITRRYDKLSLEDGQIIVSSEQGNFNLRELSTGAQEQVLLSLRMGFAALHLKKEQMFLVMDDAFQHADWQRRENLVSQVRTLASSGWQILYLTMDDHIRALFRDQFGEDLVYQDLGLDV